MITLKNADTLDPHSNHSFQHVQEDLRPFAFYPEQVKKEPPTRVGLLQPFMYPHPIQRITHRLRGTPVRDARSTLKDKALALRLYQTFERDLELAHVRGIHFYVKKSTVTLHGTIRHELDRDLLLSLIAQLDGVEAVVEHLQIADSPFQESQSEITLHL